MIFCPNCGTANRDGSKFCNECGQRLAGDERVRCSLCGADNRPGSQFCTQCGARLTPLAMAPEEEALEAGEEPAPPPLPPAGEDWLSRLRESVSIEDILAEEPATPPEEREGEPRVEAEEWLSQLRAQVEEGAPALEETFLLSGDLSTPPPLEEIAPAEEAPEEPAMPEWLTALREGGEALPPTASLPPETGTLLSRLIEAGEEVEGKAEPEPPAWLAGGIPEEIIPAEEGMPAESERPEPEEGPLPDWLRELGPPPEEEEIITPSGAVPAMGAGPFEEKELPDWIREVGISAGAPSKEKEEETAAPPQGEIPEWIMALRPHEAEPTPGPAPAAIAGDAYSEGILAGLQGLLSIQPPMARPPEGEDVGSLLESVPSADRAAEVFREVLSAKPAPHGAPAAKRRGFALGRLLSALILLAAIALPMITGVRWFTQVHEVPAPTLAAFEALDAIQAGDIVVVAFDFDPSTAGEMRPLAESMLRHILRRQGRIVAVSTMPTGPALAEGILEGVASEQGVSEYGSAYVNLGYLPGREAGIRQFLLAPFSAQYREFVTGTPADALPLLQGASQFSDTAMVLLLSASAQDARWWMEQVSGLPSHPPMVAGVSAAAEPYLMPYFQGPGNMLQGIVAGLAGAADYGAFVGGSPVPGLELEALYWAILVAAFVILAAVLVSLLKRAGPRQTAEGK